MTFGQTLVWKGLTVGAADFRAPWQALARVAVPTAQIARALAHTGQRHVRARGLTHVAVGLVVVAAHWFKMPGASAEG